MAFRLNDGTFIMGTPGSNGEELDDPLVDRFTLASTVLTHKLFAAVVSETREGAALTAADTNNNANGGQIPTNEKWWLWRLDMFYMAAALRTDAQVQLILDMFRQTNMFAEINGKAKSFNFPQWASLGSLQIQMQPAATIASQLAMKNIFSASWDLGTPIVLEANSKWFMQFDHITASNSALDGDKVGFRWKRRRIYGA